MTLSRTYAVSCLSLLAIVGYFSWPTTVFGADPIASLAEKYAPQLMHPADEPNLPANVDWFIGKVTFTFYNSDCPQDNKEFGTASLDLLETAAVVSQCSGHSFKASGTRSASRSRTFILNDLAEVYRAGSLNPADWLTYFHAYANSNHGMTIQYWVFYPYNTGRKVGPFEIGYHGGDWEMVSVVLDADSQPVSLNATGHTDMQSTPWSSVQKNQTHPIVFTERGGHEVHVDPQSPPPYIVHPTWSGSLALLPNSPPMAVGGLVDLGSKINPKVKFLRYSGLWGGLGSTPFSSGYWGPAFNETGMKQDGFLTAWCDGIAEPAQAADAVRECYAEDPQ